MSSLQRAGRILLAKEFASLPIFLAWGEGSAAWDATPPVEPTTATALLAELGRRKAQTVSYAVASATGTVELSSGKYNLSATPTDLVYLKFVFDFDDAVGKSIRELGILAGTTLKTTVPATQTYYAPGDLLTPGDLYAVEYVKAFPRVNTVRQVFEYVLPF